MRHLPHRIDQAAMEEWLKCMKSAINQNLEDEELANALYSSFPRLAQHMVNS